MKNVIRLLLFSFFIMSFTGIQAQKEVGLWKTIDDETGKEKSHVELYIKNGKLYGKIAKLLNNEEENPMCTACEGALNGEPIIGMQIVNGLTKRKTDWFKKEGILDPKNGKIYDCKMWLEDENTLNVRGFLGPFYRTQTWHRIK